MIQLNPADRHSVRDYLSKWMNSAFPECFYTFLHKYIASLNDIRADSDSASLQDVKIEKIWTDFDKIAVAVGMKVNVTNNAKTNAAGKKEQKL